MAYGAIDHEEASPLISFERELEAPRSQRRSVGAALVIVGTLALAAVSASPAAAKHVAGRAMFAAGHVISGNDQIAVSKDSAECGDCEALCASEQLFGERLNTVRAKVATDAQQKGGGGSDADDYAVSYPTASPTSHYDDWTIYFTDGAEGESYVWYMESWKSGIYASVLVDTTGFASGVSVAKNDTSIFFTDFTGSVWKVERNGYDLRELLSYEGQPMGLELVFEWTDETNGITAPTSMLYWADSMGAVCQASVDGTNFKKLVEASDFSDSSKVATTHTDAVFEPVDVKMHEYGRDLYVACATSGTIYRYDLDSDLMTEFIYLEEDAIPHGLWVDNDHQDLYFTSLSTSTDSAAHDGFVGKLAVDSAEFGDYYDSSSNVAFEKIITNVTAYGVAVDSKKEVLFVTTDTELMLCDTDGTYVETVARLENLFFVYALYLASPTVSPTPAPTSMPSPSPSKVPVPAPSPLPTSYPTAVPAPAPTSVPAPEPTSLPVPAPSKIPTASPSLAPVPSPTMLPTAFPTLAPVPSPTSLPVPAPTSAPIPSPTAAPVPHPTAAPIPSPTLVPTSIPTPVPTAVCDYYFDQCGLCECEATDDYSPQEAKALSLSKKHSKESKTTKETKVAKKEKAQ